MRALPLYLTQSFGPDAFQPPAGRDLYTIQSDLAHALLVAAGVDADEADAVRRWVAKDNLNLKNSADPAKRARVEEETQALEDAAVMVFLEKELEGFVTKIQGGEGFEREKWVDILRKYVDLILVNHWPAHHADLVLGLARTWRKLSPRGQAAALSIAPQLPQALQEIMTDAVTGVPATPA